MEPPPEYSEVIRNSTRFPKGVDDSPPPYTPLVPYVKHENWTGTPDDGVPDSRAGSTCCRSYCGRMMLCVCSTVAGLMGVIVILSTSFYYLTKVDDEKILSSYCFTRLENITGEYRREISNLESLVSRALGSTNIFILINYYNEKIKAFENQKQLRENYFLYSIGEPFNGVKQVFGFSVFMCALTFILPGVVCGTKKGDCAPDPICFAFWIFLILFFLNLSIASGIVAIVMGSEHCSFDLVYQ